jgi:GNAT superfamily N-acetyltransferase
VEFGRVDPSDEGVFGAWFDVLHRSERERDRGRDEGWRPSERRARARDEGAPVYHQLFSFGDDLHQPVAIASLEVSRLDNLAWIRAELFVDPRCRRRGYGAAALTHLEARARELGRGSILFWVVESPEESGVGACRTFAPRHGYEVVEENIVRHLDWPRPPGDLNRREAALLPFAAGYELLAWRGTTPARWRGDRAELMAAMPLEVPDAGYGLAEERWDQARLRWSEQTVAEMGRDLLVSVARHVASDALVAFSELTVSRERPATAYQWDTLVMRAHRGHRLGALMKIATMRELEAGHYATTTIMTSNSSLNTAMIALNEQLGAYRAGGIVTWRKVLLPST